MQYSIYKACQNIPDRLKLSCTLINGSIIEIPSDDLTSFQQQFDHIYDLQIISLSGVKGKAGACLNLLPG